MLTPEFCSALAVVLMRVSAVAGEMGNDEIALTIWDAVRALRPDCHEVEAFPGLLAMQRGEIAKAFPLLQNLPTAQLSCQLCDLLLNGTEWGKIRELLRGSELTPELRSELTSSARPDDHDWTEPS